jgi:hypothetical protein
MSSDAKVEAQLNETMVHLRRGARPWKVRDADIDALKRHYRPSFSLNLGLWPRVRGKIFRLAQYQGAIAALAAESLYGKPQPPRKPIPRGCLWLASFVVQIGCPPELSPHSIALGRHCRRVDLDHVDPGVLREVGQKLLNLVAAGQLSAVRRRA